MGHGDDDEQLCTMMGSTGLVLGFPLCCDCDLGFCFVLVVTVVVVGKINGGRLWTMMDSRGLDLYMDREVDGVWVEDDNDFFYLILFHMKK